MSVITGRDTGMSNRAIANARLGMDERTVRNDLKSGAENSAPDLPERTIGADGKAMLICQDETHWGNWHSLA